VLWDLLGRVHHRDIREVTVEQFAKRYHVDSVQAQRVGALALSLLKGLGGADLQAMAPFLEWAARLHEIGMSIAQAAYHKHTAYILANADMPGFSRQEQSWLANIVLAQRGKLAKMRATFEADPRIASLAACLRVAVIFYRSRRSLKLPAMALVRHGKAFRLSIDPAWLVDHSLIALALEDERRQWESVGLGFDLASG
jgi:exopolyphosphatase/guanosine-5'-triphosphate,3'-diphosphate pyrophosphatase